MNPWESLATGVLLPPKRKSSDARLSAAARSRQRQQMREHGVSTLAELRERQALRDNTKPSGFNRPVGRGFVYTDMSAQPAERPGE